MSFLAELFHQLDRVVCTENQESQRSQMAQWEIEKERERGVVVKSAIWQLYNQRHQTPCSTTRIQQGSECSERYFPMQWWDIFNFADSYEWAPCMGQKKDLRIQPKRLGSLPGYGTLPLVTSSVSSIPKDHTSDLMVKRPYKAASGAVHLIGNLAPGRKKGGKHVEAYWKMKDNLNLIIPVNTTTAF